MKARELYMRCVKARVLSWLHTGVVPAVIPMGDGNGVIVAVYQNGKYIEPEIVNIPDSPAGLWGPDGPVNMQPQGQPDEGEDDEQEEPDEDS